MRVRRWLDRSLTALALGMVAWFFHWTAESGGGLRSWGEDDLYNLLVRGYRMGQLHLDLAPPAELLALADPYDPAQNGPYRLPDASYYRGHYYLYFGVVPAVVLMLPYAVLTGHELPMGVATLVFCLIGFLAASGVWLGLRARYFPGSAVGTGALGVLVLGMSTHVLALARRPMVWELPIATGFAFVMLALAAVYAALHGRRPLTMLGLAGICLGLAVASRPPNLFGTLMMLAPLWFLSRREPGKWRGSWRYALAAAAGVGGCVAAMLVHNYARFDHALEFGQNYQLTASRELDNRHFGLDFIGQNFRSYYLFPLRWSWEFPFVSARLPAWSNPDYAGSEELCGLAGTFPFLCLALAAPLAWCRRPEAEVRPLRAMIGAMAGLYLGVGFFLLTFFSATERYMAEFSPALALLALTGWLGLERWTQGWRGGAGVRALAIIAAIATVPIGALVSFNYHGNVFSRDNPPLWNQIAETCHEALGRCGLWAGVFEGPRVLRVRFTSQPAGTRETFWQATDPRAEERVVLEYPADRQLRFGYSRGAETVRWTDPVRWEPNRTQTVELQLPSLYGAPGKVSGGVRRALEFRERSSVAVWFNGERILEGIVDPVASGTKAGGMIGTDFSGEVRKTSKRLFRADEVPGPIIIAEPRGGTLRLRLMLPEPLSPGGEPLFTAGELYGSDLVVVRDAGGGAVTLGFEHFGATPIFSKPLRLAPRREHILEITLPSCRPGERFGNATHGEVTFRVNGEEVLRTQSDCHGFAAGSERIGQNPFGTGSDRNFRGWILEAHWVEERR